MEKKRINTEKERKINTGKERITAREEDEENKDGLDCGLMFSSTLATLTSHCTHIYTPALGSIHLVPGCPQMAGQAGAGEQERPLSGPRPTEH